MVKKISEINHLKKLADINSIISLGKRVIGEATSEARAVRCYLELMRLYRNGWCSDAVSRSATHTFSKQHQESVQLLAGLGVEGDSHMGKTIKHRSRLAVDPTQPNLRQVHLIHTELHDELQAAGFVVSAGQMGENITTRGIDLLALSTDTRLYLGDTAVVQLTGLRNPCAQLNQFQGGLMAAVLGRDEHGKLIRKAGVMGIVVSSGVVKPGDTIQVELPPKPHQPLDRV